MYAVIKTGGKQYKVSPGDVIEVERLKAAGEDASVTLTPLLVVTDGGETVVGAKQLGEFPVSAKILSESKGDKVTVFKYRPKSGYASKNGHRQRYSVIQITKIGNFEASASPATGASAAAPGKGPARETADHPAPEGQEHNSA